MQRIDHSEIERIHRPHRAPFYRMLFGAVRLRCPYCGQGRVLARWPNKMRKACPVCGLSLLREPGYYIGGMIITYGLMLMIVVPAFFVSVLMPNWRGLSDNARLAAWLLFAVPLSLILMPFGYSLWLHLDFWIDPWTPLERPDLP